MQVKGTLKTVFEIVDVTASFKKREFVVSTIEQYPQHIILQLTQNNVDVIDAYKIGQEIVCDINLRGREWVNPQGETKYFNSIVCWKIQPSEPHNKQTKNEPIFNEMPSMAQTFDSDIANTSFNDEEQDDLPF